MTSPRADLVRLAAADIGLTASVWFVVNYTYFSNLRFMHERSGSALMLATDVFVAYSGWLYVMPLLVLPSGLWLVYRRPQARATLEMAISGTWLAAWALAALCVLAWQAQYVQVGSLIEVGKV